MILAVGETHNNTLFLGGGLITIIILSMRLDWWIVETPYHGDTIITGHAPSGVRTI